MRVTRFDQSVALQGDSSDMFYGRTYGSVGDFMDPCPLITPSGRYRFLVASGYEHEVCVCLWDRLFVCKAVSSLFVSE